MGVKNDPIILMFPINWFILHMIILLQFTTSLGLMTRTIQITFLIILEKLGIYF